MQSSFDLQIQTSALTHSEQLIHDRAMSRARDYHHAEAQMVQSIEEVDRLRLWQKFGETSTHAYCTKYLKMSNDVAGNFITVARATRRIPEVAEAIDRGDLSVSVARKIAPVLTPENKDEWLEKARTQTKAEVEKAVAEANPSAVTKTRVQPVGKNRNKITIEVSDEVLAMLKRVQELESNRTGKSVKLEAALERALDVCLEYKDPIRKAERAKKPAAETPKSGRRKEAAVEHEVNKRDQCACRVLMTDGTRCGSRKWTQLHHIKKVEEGGLYTAANLVTVCGEHHRQLHDELEFTL